MMKRSELVAVVILSAWLAMTLFMWFAATRSFRTVDRVLGASNVQFKQAVQALSPTETREALRYLASELNRSLFGAYGWAQISLGVLLLLLLWRRGAGNATDLVLAGVMLALAVVLTFVIEPQIVALGRAIDFLPRDPTPPQMSRFWMLHGAFTGLDGVKLLAGLWLLLRWIVRR